MKTQEKIQSLLKQLETSVSGEDFSLWVHQAAPRLSDVGIDATVALCNQIITDMNRIATNKVILEKLFEGHLEVRWTGTAEDDVLDLALYQLRLTR
jgi:hypothetical protein